MLDRIDNVIEMLFKAKKDKQTLVLIIGCLTSFGIAVGAVAVYETMLKELQARNGTAYRHASRPYLREEYDEDDEDDY